MNNPTQTSRNQRGLESFKRREEPNGKDISRWVFQSVGKILVFCKKSILKKLKTPHPNNPAIQSSKLKPSEVILIGARDLDPEARALLKASRIGIYTMREIDECGIATVVHEALTRLAHLPRVHVSLDMDSLDPMAAPGVGTPVAGGLTYREAHLLMEIIADTGCVGSIDVVEINPILDERNHTAEIAAELLTSLLGKSIL